MWLKAGRAAISVNESCSLQDVKRIINGQTTCDKSINFVFRLDCFLEIFSWKVVANINYPGWVIHIFREIAIHVLYDTCDINTCVILKEF